MIINTLTAAYTVDTLSDTEYHVKALLTMSPSSRREALGAMNERLEEGVEHFRREAPDNPSFNPFRLARNHARRVWRKGELSVEQELAELKKIRRHLRRAKKLLEANPIDKGMWHFNCLATTHTLDILEEIEGHIEDIPTMSEDVRVYVLATIYDRLEEGADYCQEILSKHPATEPFQLAWKSAQRTEEMGRPTAEQEIAEFRKIRKYLRRAKKMFDAHPVSFDDSGMARWPHA